MIEQIDHLVLTVRSLDATCAFYEKILGMRRVDAASRPTALVFGHQKINVHEVGKTFAPNARKATAGSADFCLITSQPLNRVEAHVREHGVAIEVGPVPREGARGAMSSIYFRDPDGNLVEVSEYAAAPEPPR
jgi:catechol 2,3-dioxygenase-like lactoylglutathione lyase family enzyme